MRWCRDLSAEDAEIGGKARSLARLAALDRPVPPDMAAFAGTAAVPPHGPSVPPGFAVGGAVYRALREGGPALPSALRGPDDLAALDAARAALLAAPWPRGFEDDLDARLAGLPDGTRFSVRSSFASEDDARALAPGVYLSRIDVPRTEVAAAVRHVLGSALAPGAVAYALGRGRPPEPDVAAVLVHRFVDGEACGSAAHDPTAPVPVIDLAGTSLSDSAHGALAATLQVLGSRHGAVEVEWVASGDALTLLQMRPWSPPPPPRPFAGEAELPAGLDWRWDAEHNPLPLSGAQAALVALVDGRCATGLRQTVAGGYLFVATGGRPAPRTIAPAQARAFFDELRAEADRRLAALGDAPDLDAALDLFCAIYEPLYGVLQPALRRARQMLADFLRVNLPEALPRIPTLLSGVESIAAERRRRAGAVATAAPAERDGALSAYLDRFGDESPAWDVAVPTFREDPAPLAARLAAPPTRAGPPPDPDAWQSESRAILDRLPRMARGAWKGLLPVARDAVALGEEDDHLYARLQTAVRRALLARGPIDPPPARLPPPPVPAAAGILIRGAAGAPGRVIGRVRHADDSPTDGDVVIAATLLPAHLPLVRAAALVVETGGPLGHVAAQARERGIPAVVGAAGATTTLHPGDLVLVDGDAGLAVKLG